MVKRTMTMWLLYGPISCVHHEEVMTSKWSSLVFGEVVVRWQSYDKIVLWDEINWLNGECLASQHCGRPLLKEYLVNIIDILGGQYSWYQMWYQNLIWVLGDYHWYSGRPILLILDVISNLIWVLAKYHMLILWKANTHDIKWWKTSEISLKS